MISRFQACLLGYAIGDALAAPVEDNLAPDLQPCEPVYYYSKPLPSHPLSHLSLGQYSDETQVMLKVSESIIESHGFNADNLIEKFVEWYQSQKKRLEWRFPGNTMINSCRKLASGTNSKFSGTSSAGIIASIRTIPFALVFYKQRDKLIQAISGSCRLTHTDPRVVAVSEVLASVIEMGIIGKDFSAIGIINRALEVSTPKSQELTQKLNIIRSCLNSESSENAIETIGNSGYCIEAFANALYRFLKSECDFDKTIITAANGGGDCDAIAAMAGAMCGAFIGLGRIPQKWLDKLENCDLIKRAACAIYNIANEI